MNSNLNLEGWVSIFLIDGKIGLRDEGNFLVGSFSTENITQRYILESF